MIMGVRGRIVKVCCEFVYLMRIVWDKGMVVVRVLKELVEV